MNKGFMRINYYEECIPNIQNLLVEYFGKLVLRVNYEKGGKKEKKFETFDLIIKKKESISQIIQFLGREASEKSQIICSEYKEKFINYIRNIGKLPELLYKYYNLECDSLKEKIDQIKAQKEVCSNNICYSSPNVLNYDAKEFFDYIDEQISIFDLILFLIKDFVEIIIKIKAFNEQNPDKSYIEDSEFCDLSILDKNLIKIENLMNNSNNNNYKYLKNSYDSIFSLFYQDFTMLKALIFSYKNILNVDMILSTTNMISAVKTIDQIKKTYSDLGGLNLYSFFLYFYMDNYHKYNLIFETYIFKKQNKIVMEMNSNLEPNLNIIEEIFRKKTNKYEDKFTSKCDEHKIDFTYFLMVFEKRKFYDSIIYNEKSNILKYQYIKDNGYIESNEQYGILKIFHMTTPDNTSNILKEISSLDRKDKNNKQYKLASAKLKEKNCDDLKDLNEICNDFKEKFSNKHII